MTVELNNNKYKVKRYKGEELSAYLYKGLLLDTVPKHHDVYGIFHDYELGNIGVVDKIPTFISIPTSLVLVGLTGIFLSATITAVSGSYAPVAVIEPIVTEINTESTVEKVDYKYTFDYNKYAISKDGTLYLNVMPYEDCTLSIVSKGKVLAQEEVKAYHEWNPDVTGDNLSLVCQYDHTTVCNALSTHVGNSALGRTRVTVTPTEISQVVLDDPKSDIYQYTYYSNGNYVNAEIICIDDEQCIHIETNCDISKNYWDNDYKYPVVIGYTDNNEYNMVLGTGDKKNVPENVKIINNMFSLETCEQATSNYFTYEKHKGITDIYVPLGSIDSEELPLGKDAIIVPSDSEISVQINSAVVQRGRDNVHAILIKG